MKFVFLLDRAASAVLVATLLLVSASAVANAALQPGVVVVEVTPGFAAAKADIRPGDVIVKWSRGAGSSEPANDESRIETQFDVDELEIAEGPRGPVTLFGMRGANRLAWTMPPGWWRLRVVPQLARTLPHRCDVIETPECVAAAADDARAAGYVRVAVWLVARAADLLDGQKRPQLADVAYQRAEEVAEAHHISSYAVRVLQQWAAGRKQRAEYDKAEERYRTALLLSRRYAPEGLDEVRTLGLIGSLKNDRGESVAAQGFFRQALSIAERQAPDSSVVGWILDGLTSAIGLGPEHGSTAETYALRALAIHEKLAPDTDDLARTLFSLGLIANFRGDGQSAARYLERALHIQERLAPESRDVAAIFSYLGSSAHLRGDLQSAARYFERAHELWARLEPGGVDVATSLAEMGQIAEERGDLVTAVDLLERSLQLWQQTAYGQTIVAGIHGNLAEIAMMREDPAAAREHYRRAQEIIRRAGETSPSGRLQTYEDAVILTNLGKGAFVQGDLPAATDYFRQALKIHETLTTDGAYVAQSLLDLASVEMSRNEFAGAMEHVQRALLIQQKLAPESVAHAVALRGLAIIALHDGMASNAETYLLQALAILERTAPGSRLEAATLWLLGNVKGISGNFSRAAEYYERSMKALDAEAKQLGGSDEVRTTWSAGLKQSSIGAITASMDMNDPSRALHALEYTRARSLLLMLAERDLVPSPADLPADLAAERQAINTEYQRVQTALALPDPGERAQAEQLAQRLRELRDKRESIAARIRKTSPRFASLHYPEPLDLAGIRSTLDAGTVLLSFAVGPAKTFLFVMQPTTPLVPDASDVTVFTIPLGENDLRQDVTAFRKVLQHPDSDHAVVTAQATALYDRLLKPVERFLAASTRVLIEPDGPLHVLPFAALMRTVVGADRPAHQYFVEWKPLHFVVSSTLYAELKKTRRPTNGSARVVAFGDPHYPALADQSPEAIGSPQVRAVVRGGFRFPPLPATRTEVEALGRLYPQAELFLGTRATEDQVKALGRDVRYLHLAAHGVLDERFPLNSAIALTIPDQVAAGQDDGLLQAWEIFEQVRLDADLVTLSACDTALGTELGGEGLVGLTRAFHYAGARSVLASLWSVADASTADLMARVYRHLREGLSKDEALRAAQVELLHTPQSAHPFHWAGFQLFGDWQ